MPEASTEPVAGPEVSAGAVRRLPTDRGEVLVEPEATELEPGRLQVTLADGGSCVVLVPAGVGVPGASDEDLAAAVVQVLIDGGHPVPTTFEVPQVLRAHPEVWSEVQRRLDG